MPRNFASFTTSIYRDDDFRALTLSQQGAYFMLGLQSDITAAGVLSLALGRWASKAHDLTRSDLERELGVLQDRGHVAIDYDTEELLIVKFAKWDKGWANRLRRPVLISAVKAIESIHIRDIAVDELSKIALSDAASDDDKQAREALSHALSGFDRFPVQLGEYGLEPETSIHEGEPSNDSPFCDEHQPDGPGGKPCTNCADKRRAREHRAKQAAAETEATRRARLAAIAACTRCNENGFIEGPGGELLGSCSHSDLRLVGGAVAG